MAIEDDLLAHVDSFRITFLTSAGIALLGAVVASSSCAERTASTSVRVFGRRSRWLWMSSGLGPGITRRPPAGNDDA